MRIDGIEVVEGSRVSNLTVNSGNVFPSNPDVGELFFKTDTDQLYNYRSSGWTPVAAGGGMFTISGDVSGTIDGGVDTLTLNSVNSTPGTFGSATTSAVVSVNGKGLITAISSTPIQITESQITDGSIFARVASAEAISGSWTFTTNPSISHATSSRLFITGPVGTTRGVQFQTSSSNRWYVGTTASAESGANAGSDFTISSSTDAGGALADALTILRSNSNVGIGTSNPGARLETTLVSSGQTGEVLRLSNSGTGANTQAAVRFYAASTHYATISGGFGASAPQMTFDLPSVGNYVWSSGAVERMRIDSTGRLLIGRSTSPASSNNMLTLKSTTGDAYLQFDSLTGNRGCSIGGADGGFALYTYTGAQGAEAYTERIRINANGTVKQRFSHSGPFQTGGSAIDLNAVLPGSAGTGHPVVARIDVAGSENGDINTGYSTWLVIRRSGGFSIAKTGEITFGNGHGIPTLTVNANSLVVTNLTNSNLGGWKLLFTIMD